MRKCAGEKSGGPTGFFAEEKISEAGFVSRFENSDLDKCVEKYYNLYKIHDISKNSFY